MRIISYDSIVEGRAKLILDMAAEHLSIEAAEPEDEVEQHRYQGRLHSFVATTDM